MRSSRYRWTLVLALTASFAIGGCGARSESDDERTPEPVVPVRVLELPSRTFEDRVEATGQWKSQGELSVGARFGGVIERLSVRPGDQVRAGQTIGTMTTLESHAAVQGAEMMEREARDSLARGEARRAVRLALRDRVTVPIAAPQAGIVVRRSVEPGAQVAEAAEVVAIVPWAGLVFEAHLPQDQRGRVRVGQRAVIHEEASAPRAATVERILPAADPADQSTLVWLRPASLSPAPQLDHFGTASITVGAARVATAVPDSAVIEDDVTGEKRVAVVDTSRHAHWTAVTLGPAEGGWHALRAPALKAGTRVVVEGQRGLPDGSRVQWTP